jgi:hypothetical protein
LNRPPPPYGVIRNLLKEGSIVVFFGAGASLIQRQPPPETQPGTAPDHPWTTWLPTGNQLRAYLAGQTELDLTHDSLVELATVAQYYTWAVGRPDLYRSLHNIFAVDYTFGKVHKLFADLKAPLLVLTTNYDDMIEKAFKAAGKPFDLVVHQTSNEAQSGSVMFQGHEAESSYVKPNEVMIDLERTSVIYKMHGTVATGNSVAESYVITEDDYVDFLVRMGSNTPIPAMIQEAFIDRHFLFLGYGLADWNFRVMLGSLKEHLMKQRSWAIRWQGSPVEEAIWGMRGVLMYDMKVEDFGDVLGPV